MSHRFLFTILAIAATTIPGTAQIFGSGSTTYVDIPGSVPVKDIASIDFNHDHYPDVAALSSENIHVYNRYPHLMLLEDQTLPHDGTGTTLGAGDVNGDGNIDLVLGSTGVNTIYLGDGAFGFTPLTPASWAASPAVTTDLELVDTDGDGTAEIFEANDGAPNRVWEFQPTGLFVNRLSGFSQSNDRTQAVAVSPPDAGGFRLAHFFNLANQDFTLGITWQSDYTDESSRFPAHSRLSVDGTWTDVDQDLRYDLVTLYADLSPTLFLNGVTGFTASTDPFWTALGPQRRVVAGDWSHNGFPDLTFFADNARPSFATNDGSGLFTTGFGVLFSSLNPLEPHVTDWDNNGYLDFAAGDQNGFYVAHNRSFLFSATEMPRIGAEIRFEQYGRATEDRTTIVFGSFGLQPTPVDSPFGWIHLGWDMVPVVEITTPRFFSRGTASIVVPNRPALIGLELNWQGAYFSQDLSVLKATNLQWSRILSF